MQNLIGGHIMKKSFGLRAAAGTMAVLLACCSGIVGNTSCLLASAEEEEVPFSLSLQSTESREPSFYISRSTRRLYIAAWRVH